MANKIIVFTGPHEGVGKSTLAANLAARYAQNRRQPVILVDADPLCRGEVAQIAGAVSSLSVFQILDQLANRQLSLPMLRGRIPLSRLNLGALALTPGTGDASSLTPERWNFFLRALAQLYDVIVDIEATSPLRTTTLDVADVVIWTFLPNALSLRSTAQQLESLQAQKFGLQKFLFASSQVGLPNSLSEDSVNELLSRFDRELDTQVPFEAEVTRLVNAGKPVLLENPRWPYYMAIGPLLERLPKFQRPESDPLTQLPELNKKKEDGLPRKSVSNLQTAVVDGMIQEKHRRWDTIKQQLHRELVEELNIRRIDLDTKGDPVRERQLRTNVESTVNALIGKEKELSLSREDRERLVKELVDEALGLGPLEELLADPSITEIMVNRFDQIYIERRGKILLSDKRFIDNNHIVQVVRRIIAPLSRRIDESVPMVDARLKDGSRVNAIIPPLAVQGPSVTIRRFPDKAFSPEDLLRLGALTKPMIDFLRLCVLLKKNLIISGGTGTGKTTILNLLSGFIPNDERIITVEDTAELRMQQDHVVRLEARPANLEGQGQVSIRDLVKNCLRMRPDRIVIGECRGGEALDMLQAMNTGHEGSLTTIHANSPDDAFARLETLCLMAGMDLPVWALREQIRSAVHIVVQLSRLQDGNRKVTRITEVMGRDEEKIKSQDIFRFVQDSVDAQGRVVGHHEATGAIPKLYPELQAKGLAADLAMFSAGKPAPGSAA